MAERTFAIETVKSFISDCHKIGLSFEKVFLFGSYSRGTADDWSDVDVLLVSKQFSKNTLQNLKLYAKINSHYPILETHPYPKDYFDSGDPFLQDVLKTAIEITQDI